MSIDWSQISVEHIRQASDLFDAGSAVPKRPVRSTVLHFGGKTYPAKFIRGLAYRIATGVELEPNKDFSGGDETARFFATLGFYTSASTTPAADTSLSAPSPCANID